MSGICTECAICCDGTLFTHGDLAPTDDIEPLVQKRAMLDLVDEPRLRFPCTALESRRCSIYESRPAVCRQYRCRLLKAVESGAVEADAALAIIAETIRYRDRVRTTAETHLDPVDQDAVREGRVALFDVYSKIHDRLMADEDADPAERRARLLELAALRMLIFTHFKKRPAPTDRTDTTA